MFLALTSDCLILFFLAIFQIIQSIRMGIWVLHILYTGRRSVPIRHSSRENRRLQFWRQLYAKEPNPVYSIWHCHSLVYNVPGWREQVLFYWTIVASFAPLMSDHGSHLCNRTCAFVSIIAVTFCLYMLFVLLVFCKTVLKINSIHLGNVWFCFC